MNEQSKTGIQKFVEFSDVAMRLMLPWVFVWVLVGGALAKQFGSFELGMLGGAVIATLAMWAYYRWEQSRPLPVVPPGFWREGVDRSEDMFAEKGYPFLLWTENVPTGKTAGMVRDTVELVVIVSAAVLGAWVGYSLFGGSGYGVPQWWPILGAVGGCAAGLGFGQYIRRDRWRSVLRPQHRGPTRGEMRDARVLTKPVECRARIELRDGELMFVSVRGRESWVQGTGIEDLKPVVTSRVPWGAFGNFAEGDFAPWFRPTSEPSSIPWGKALIVEAPGHPMVLVSHSDDPVFARNLRTELERLFVIGRDEALEKFKAAKATGALRKS